MRSIAGTLRRVLMSRSALGVLIAGAGAAMAAHPAFAQAEGKVEEVIVTATKREEILRKVPIAITALSGQQVKDAHIANFDSIPALVPGANFISTKGQSTADIEIRGQATTNDAPALEVPIAIYQDDVYYSSLASFDMDLFDVAQLAILRGPQGTTFGRNVVGGLVQITSNMPHLGENRGEIIGTVEAYENRNNPGFESQGYYNAALGDDWAGRLAYSVKDVGGYMHNAITGHDLSDQKSFALRPSLRWQPNEDLTVTAFVNYVREDEAAAGYHFYGQGSTVAKNSSSDPWISFQDFDGVNRRTISASQIRADWKQSYGTWTSITSYRTLNAFYQDDGDSGPLPSQLPGASVNASKEFELSQEVRLTSPSGQRFEYIGGLYYSFENLRKEIDFGFNGTVPGIFLGGLTGGKLQLQNVIGDDHTVSVAPFGEFTFHVFDQLALRLGARYTVEDKSGFTDHVGASVFYGAAYAAAFSHTWSALTSHASIDWSPFDNTLFYASWATGFKGGGWSLTSTSAVAAMTPLQPEKSTSYEIGSKTQFFDRKLSVNIAAYQATTDNLQVRSLVGPVLTDTNAGQERVRGVEVETTATIAKGLQIGGSLAVTDAIYTSFRGCAAGGVNCSGMKVPYVPSDDLTVFAQYRYEFPSGAGLTFHVDDKFAGHTQVNPLNYSQPLAIPYTRKDGILNASISYEPPTGKYQVQLWGKNLTNKWYMSAPSNYYFYYLTTAEFAAGAREVERGTINPPAQFGITLSLRFD